jgi:hypothetical protein
MSGPSIAAREWRDSVNYDSIVAPRVMPIMYKRRRALQSTRMIKPELGSVVVLGREHDPGLRAFCDRIVPRSENDDNHDRFELRRVNKLRRLRW